MPQLHSWYSPVFIAKKENANGYDKKRAVSVKEEFISDFEKSYEYKKEVEKQFPIMLHFLLSFGHNHAIIVPKKEVKHYANYYAY